MGNNFDARLKKLEDSLPEPEAPMTEAEQKAIIDDLKKMLANYPKPSSEECEETHHRIMAKFGSYHGAWMAFRKHLENSVAGLPNEPFDGRITRHVLWFAEPIPLEEVSECH